MKKKKRYIAVVVGIGVVLGWLTLGGIQVAMHATSTTEFCVSCHTMQTPYEEYQSSVHYTNSKGIRAGCADCHIPQEPMDYLITKIRASKDVYHEFVTGKIDTDEKYEEHRAAMAENVWAELIANDSATCRSCHSFDAMEIFEQSEGAQKMHEYAQENNQTCIECHKGVAHIAPVMELDTSEFDHLFDLAKSTKADAKKVYPIDRIKMGELAVINPTVELTVDKPADANKRTVTISGYQREGAESVMYVGEGQRSIIAMLSEKGQKAVKLGEPKTDDYDVVWRSASLTGEIDSPVLESNEPLWEYAETLDTVYCSTCHSKIPSNHFTVNAWGPVAKGMGERTDISKLNLEILTKFFQNHAKDVGNHEQAGTDHE